VHRPSLLDKRHRLPGEITSHAVWLHYQDGIIPDIFVQPRRIACPDGRHSRKQQEVLVTIVRPTKITGSVRAAAPAAPPEPGAGDSPARSLRALQTGHVGVNVTDTERSGRFYREVFGLDRLGESQEDGRRFVFLGHAEKLVLTLWQQSAGRFDAARPGLHHLSFQVESIEDVREVERRLRARGARFLYDGIVPHGEGADSGGVYFEDPDGIRLEVYAPAGARGRPAPAAGAPSCGFF